MFRKYGQNFANIFILFWIGGKSQNSMASTASNTNTAEKFSDVAVLMIYCKVLKIKIKYPDFIFIPMMRTVCLIQPTAHTKY